MTFSGPLVPIPDTLREVSYPLMFFKLQIPVSNLGTDTQREYRYPKAGTDTLRLGTDTLRKNLQRSSATASFSKGVQRSPTARITFGTIKQASKHQGKTNAYCIKHHYDQKLS
ncbi:hypothetical protein GQ457_03G011760 [Hibiscus cannabinus]